MYLSHPAEAAPSVLVGAPPTVALPPLRSTADARERVGGSYISFPLLKRLIRCCDRWKERYHVVVLDSFNHSLA